MVLAPGYGAAGGKPSHAATATANKVCHAQRPSSRTVPLTAEPPPAVSGSRIGVTARQMDMVYQMAANVVSFSLLLCLLRSVKGYTIIQAGPAPVWTPVLPALLHLLHRHHAHRGAAGGPNAEMARPGGGHGLNSNGAILRAWPVGGPGFRKRLLRLLQPQDGGGSAGESPLVAVAAP